MKPVVKKILLGVSAVLGLGVLGAGGFALSKASAFDASMEKTYDVPLPTIVRSTDAAVLERGKHVVEAIGACNSRDCHGADYAGGNPIVMGPVATLTGPNITQNGLLAAYSDAELARMLRHGVKKDGRSLRFMPVQDFNWLPDSDIVAAISYLRTVPGVDKTNGMVKVGLIGKILDRNDVMILDVARHIDHGKIEIAPSPSATPAYGKFVARLCTGCHGERLSGGPIPGAPSSMPKPLNLTLDDTGLKGWTFADFDKTMRTAVRKNGKTLDPFMPVSAWQKMDETEMKALWSYLETLPPLPYGQR
jgi:cytochrome c5